MECLCALPIDFIMFMMFIKDLERVPVTFTHGSVLGCVTDTTDEVLEYRMV